MKRPFTKTVVRKDAKQQTIQELIRLWETKIMPDCVKTCEAFTDEQRRTDAYALLTVIENRVMAQIVLDVMGVEVDKKADKSVQRVS